MKSVGEVIRQKRHEMNLTLDQLALLINSTKAYLSRLENNHIKRPGPDILKRLSKQLDISYNTLIRHSGYMEKDNSIRHIPNDSYIKASSIIKMNNEDIWIKEKKLSDKEQQRFLKMIKLFYNLD